MMTRLSVTALLGLTLVACGGSGTKSKPDAGELDAEVMVDAAPDAAPDATFHSGIGIPCTGSGFSQGTCATGQVCIPDGAAGFTGGYCTLQCSASVSCPSDARCVQGQFPLCLATCMRPQDCRAGYLCSGGACQPASDGSSVQAGTNNGAACVTPSVDPQSVARPFATNLAISPSGSLGAETELAVDPLNGHVVVSWIDIGNGSNVRIGASMSDNGGTSFHPAFDLPNAGSIDHNTSQSDPVVAADLLGNFYITWLGFDTSSRGQPINMTMYVARSTNGGTSFDDLVNVAPGEWVTNGTLDKPWIAASPMDGTLYATWSRTTSNQTSMDLRLSRSTDHGVTWSTPITFSETTARPSLARNLAQVVVGADGKAYITWVELSGTAQYGSTANRIYLQRLNADGSLNGGNVLVSLAPDSPTFEDPSVTVAGSNVYVGFVSGTSMGNWDVRVAASLDGGATFGPSVKVNDDATCATHFKHQLATDAGGNLWVTWVDNRYLQGNVFVASSAPAQAATPLHFSANRFVADTAFDFTTSRQADGWLGDYLGFSIVGNQGYATWTDTRVAGKAQVFFAKGTLTP